MSSPGVRAPESYAVARGRRGPLRAGIASARALMAMLPLNTWIRLLVWLAIGLTIVFTKGRKHTTEKFGQLSTGND